MLAVYETIDLGLVSMLSQSSAQPSDPALLDLLQGNYVLLTPDPIHDDTVYVSHAFGVHTLILGPMLQSLAVALREDDDTEGNALTTALKTSAGTDVYPILNTFSIERK
jgi:nucleoporin NUP82